MTTAAKVGNSSPPPESGWTDPMKANTKIAATAAETEQITKDQIL